MCACVCGMCVGCVLSIVRRSAFSCTLPHRQLSESETLTDVERHNLDKWRRGGDRLENALHKVDKLIALLQDF